MVALLGYDKSGMPGSLLGDDKDLLFSPAVQYINKVRIVDCASPACINKTKKQLQRSLKGKVHVWKLSKTSLLNWCNPS